MYTFLEGKHFSMSEIYLIIVEMVRNVYYIHVYALLVFVLHQENLKVLKCNILEKIILICKEDKKGILTHFQNKQNFRNILT